MTTLSPGRCRWCGITAVVASGYICREHLMEAQLSLMTQRAAWVLTGPVALTAPVIAPQPSRPWWQSDAAVAWSLMLVPPLGVGLMWRYARWGHVWKWMWTVLAAVLALNMLAAMDGSSNVQTTPTTVSAPRQTAVRAATVAATVTAPPRATVAPTVARTVTPPLLATGIPPLTAPNAAEIAARAAGGAPLIGPLSGGLAHRDNTSVAISRAGVMVSDFVAEVRFTNPYDRAVSTWDYGLFFRHEASNQQYRLAVTSSEVLSIHNRSGADQPLLATGVVWNLRVAAGEANTLRLLVLDDWAYVWLNEEYDGAVRVGSTHGAGDVLATTGNFTGNNSPGATTRFEGFAVWGLAGSAATATAAATATPAQPSTPTAAPAQPTLAPLRVPTPSAQATPATPPGACPLIGTTWVRLRTPSNEATVPGARQSRVLLQDAQSAIEFALQVQQPNRNYLPRDPTGPTEGAVSSTWELLAPGVIAYREGAAAPVRISFNATCSTGRGTSLTPAVSYAEVWSRFDAP